MYRALAAISHHVHAVIPKGREVWEIHIDQEEIRDKIEVEGIVIRGRSCEVSPRFSGGTWVMVRGLPLTTRNGTLDRLIAKYGEVVVTSNFATWRNTNIKTGDRTVKVKLTRDIPGKIHTQSFGWISLRHRDQPDLCFKCGKPGHQQWDCDMDKTCGGKSACRQCHPQPNIRLTTRTSNI